MSEVPVLGNGADDGAMTHSGRPAVLVKLGIGSGRRPWAKAKTESA